MKPSLLAILSRLRMTRVAARGKKSRGFAMVTVLGMIALCMVIVVALLSVSEVSFKAENTGLDQSRVRLAADNAVNMALSQLMTATTQKFPDGTPKPWTSQPGAIRVHGMDGNLETLHKLYTAQDMEVPTLTGLDNDAPSSWQGNPDVFVDLNEPRETSNGRLTFPIVDPRAKTTDVLSSVEGFDYSIVNGAVGPGGLVDNQRLPMPVRWIYQLRDGSLCSIDNGGRLQSAGTPPSKENPVVSRFAYWVDDETSKININTASEGAYWDVPVADTTQERSLAQTQPTRLEYARQPGHPAGVSLSSVFLPNRRLYPQDTTSPENTMAAMGLDDARDFWRMGRLTVAELGKGTSFAGLQVPDWAELWETEPYSIVRQPRCLNTDELLIDTVDIRRYPTLWGLDSRGKRRVHSYFLRHPEAVERLGRSHFFLTARSAGPEVTLFGTPRVAMWPVHKDALLNGASSNPSDPMKRDSVYDHKMAMIGMLGSKPYFVQRSEPGNGGNDFEAHASGANKKLYEYLLRLTDRPFPGYSRPLEGLTSFVEKYGDDRDAIVMEMMDYIRATNFADGQLADNMQFSILCPGVEHKGFGQVSPLQERVTGPPAGTSNHIQGLGRAMTVSELALVFVCRAQVDAEGVVRGSPSSSAARALLVKPGDREIEVGLMVEGFVPGQGWTDYRPYIGVALVGGKPGDAPDRRATMPKITLNGKDLVLATNGNTMDSGELPPTEWQGAGGSIGMRSLTDGTIQFKPVVVTMRDDGTEPPLTFVGGSDEKESQLKLAVYDSPGSITAVDLLQVIPFVLPDIPAANVLPLPSLPKDTEDYTLTNRMKKAVKTGKKLIVETDVAQSLAPIHGDYRLTAAQHWAVSCKAEAKLDSATPVFVPHPQWGKLRFANTLRDAAIPADTTRTGGYIDSLKYSSAQRSDIPATLEEANKLVTLWEPQGGWTSFSKLENAIDKLRLDEKKRGPALPELTGDFDNGMGTAPDGPYINRPDDGHWAAAKAGKIPYFDNVSQTGATVPPVSDAVFSAQRLLPSPVMFGSLPTGVRAQVPWQTLLFRPKFETDHYGARTPPDHVLLDLFWSPVIEPEPISQAFETEGKINLNYELLPFRYIKRATALHAAMKSEMITAIPDSASETYKTGTAPDDKFRHFIDVKNTLKLWEAAISDLGRVFLTPGQICELPLVPEGLVQPGMEPSYQMMVNYWSTHRLTGDNTKERPYARLYSRLTTRSNTFRVHFVAQALKKARSTDPDVFDSSKDSVGATTSGSALLSRRLNTENPAIPDYQTYPTKDQPPLRPLDDFYRWRVETLEMAK